MGLLRRFEKRLERVFEEPFARAFKSGVHPLEIARKLIKEVDDNRALGVKETIAPNYYQVELSGEDYERLSGYFDSLRSELESLVITHSNSRGYHLLSRPCLSFQMDGDLGEGEFHISTSLDRPKGVQPPTERINAGRNGAGDENRLGVLTLLSGNKAGYTYNLQRQRARIGRSEDNDIVLADPRASRFHAEVERRADGYVLRDLESTNGTRIRGRPVRERLLEDGDTVVMGATEMRFGLITDFRKK